MARYLIEVVQKPKNAEKNINNALKVMGSHFVTHARWEKNSDMCIGSIIIEGRDEQSLRQIIPPSMRNSAQISKLEMARTIN